MIVVDGLTLITLISVIFSCAGIIYIYYKVENTQFIEFITHVRDSLRKIDLNFDENIENKVHIQNVLDNVQDKLNIDHMAMRRDLSYKTYNLDKKCFYNSYLIKFLNHLNNKNNNIIEQIPNFSKQHNQFVNKWEELHDLFFDKLDNLNEEKMILIDKMENINFFKYPRLALNNFPLNPTILKNYNIKQVDHDFWLEHQLPKYIKEIDLTAQKMLLTDFNQFSNILLELDELLDYFGTDINNFDITKHCIGKRGTLEEELDLMLKLEEDAKFYLNL